MWNRGSSNNRNAAPAHAASNTNEVVIMPRNFRLLVRPPCPPLPPHHPTPPPHPLHPPLQEELEHAEKGHSDANISLGLINQEDILLRDWNGSIFGPMGGTFENRLFELRLHCGDHYPNQPPVVQFISRINLPCVDPNTGAVNPSRVPVLAQWDRSFTMERVLGDLRREMQSQQNRRLPQPPDGSRF